MKEIHKNASYKILQVELPKGQMMPRHFATSDAFLIVEKGEAKLTLPDHIQLLEAGSSYPIPAKAPHTLEILADFRAYVIVAPGATIEFTEA